MNFFNRWLHKKMRYCWENSHMLDASSGMAVNAIDVANSSNLHSLATNIRFYRANGGFVVEVNTPDNRAAINGNYDHPYKLHIINEGANLGEELSKILTFESLRK